MKKPNLVNVIQDIYRRLKVIEKASRFWSVIERDLKIDKDGDIDKLRAENAEFLKEFQIMKRKKIKFERENAELKEKIGVISRGYIHDKDNLWGRFIEGSKEIDRMKRENQDLMVRLMVATREKKDMEEKFAELPDRNSELFFVSRMHKDNILRENLELRREIENLKAENEKLKGHVKAFKSAYKFVIESTNKGSDNA